MVFLFLGGAAPCPLIMSMALSTIITEKIYIDNGKSLFQYQKARSRKERDEKRKQAHDFSAMCLFPWEVEREKYEKMGSKQRI